MSLASRRRRRSKTCSTRSSPGFETRSRPRASEPMDGDTPALSVVIPVYNEGENVVPTLRGVVERTRTRPLEVLVVHDFDEDTTVPVVERLQADMPELRLHRNTLGRGVVNALK